MTASSLPSGDQSAEPPFSRTSRGAPAAERDGHSSARRDRQNPRREGAERPRLGAAHPCRKDLARRPIPGGGVDDRLPVGREPRARQEPPSKREDLARWRRGFAVAPKLESLASEERQRGEGETRQQPGGEDGPRYAQTAIHSPRILPDRRDLGTVVSKCRQVSREILRQAVALLRVLGQAPLDDPDQVRRGFRRRSRKGLGLVLNDR